MRTIFEEVILRETFDLNGLLAKIDAYHIEGKLTDDDRAALYALAREHAHAEHSVDIMQQLEALEKRVAALEQGATTPEPSPDAPAYVVGKWYYAGDKVTYKGKVYLCIAPQNVVCVWDPEAYPAYWKAQG